jgi:hypothetical protein
MQGAPIHSVTGKLWSMSTAKGYAGTRLFAALRRLI